MKLNSKRDYISSCQASQSLTPTLNNVDLVDDR